MAKSKTAFVCGECGFDSPRWSGQCPNCGKWNTMSEVMVEPPKSTAVKKRADAPTNRPKPVNDIGTDDLERISTGISELDRVLSGGFIEGGVALLGGEPGVGKSTLLLQAMQNIAASGKCVLYISGEESERQVAMRARRLNAVSDSLFVLSETDADKMAEAIESMSPRVVVVDSVQTAYRSDINSAPGSISQVRECAAMLMRDAKESGYVLILVGHVTKDGSIAGPRILEHMVDTVLYFEGERQTSMRILRAVKNRFGATDEIGIFEMGSDGMKGVADASAYLLESMARGVAGVAVACPMEGSRPVLIEIQALTVDSAYQNPRRLSQGIDFNRMVLLAAVLERRGGVSLAGKDIYLNAVGGMRINEPSCDLAAVCAMASAATGLAIRENTAMIGEVGLSGEVRHTSQLRRRIEECVRMGFDRVVAPVTRGLKAEDIKDAEVIFVRDVAKALASVLYVKQR